MVGARCFDWSNRLSLDRFRACRSGVVPLDRPRRVLWRWIPRIAGIFGLLEPNPLVDIT